MGLVVIYLANLQLRKNYQNGESYFWNNSFPQNVTFALLPSIVHTQF